jgi:hypothetical protein
VPHLRIITASVAALLLLGGCQRKHAPVEPPPPGFVLADAMQHWYGRYDAATQTARANLPEHPSLDLAGSWFAPNDPVDIVVVFNAGYTQAGRQRQVLVTAAVPHRSDKPGRPGDETFNCLMCRPVIGMAVFTLRGNSWLLENENDAVDLAGSGGLPPAIKLITVGTDLHGVRLESHIEAADFASSSVSLLVPWKGDVVRAFTGDTAYNNRGACGPNSPLRDPCYAWQRADGFASVPGQDYDDLTLTGSGTQPAPELAEAKTVTPAKPSRVRGKQKPAPPPAPEVLPFTRVERLRFKDGKYLPLPDTDTAIPEH